MSELFPPPVVRDPRRPFAPSPFTSLARTHAFSVAGDALFFVSLAGSVFFSVSPNEARVSIGLYLLLTFAPFAVAAPFIGPALDRAKGGRRWMIVATLAIRALLCVLIVRDIDKVQWYFEAFLMLVFSKAYLISRAAVVPTTVRSDRELVEANSKLALLSGIAAIAGGGPGLLLLKIGGNRLGPQLAVGLGAIVFGIGVVFAARLPRVRVANEKAGAVEKLELRNAGIRLAASAMALLRAAVGLLFLLLAFAFKSGALQPWMVAAAGVAAQGGVLAGAALAPRLRQAFNEPRIIIGSLAATMIGGIVAALLGGVVGAMLLSFLLGTTSGTAKQSFDALVQRDAPDANRGRSFARFETRFQLAWVLGAAIPLLLPLPLFWGYLIIGASMAVAMLSYWIGQRRVARGTYEWDSPGRKLLRRVGWRPPPFGRSRAVGPSPDATAVVVPPPPEPIAVAAGIDAASPSMAGAPLPPPPGTPGGSATDAWVPRPGFISRGLNDDATLVDADVTTLDPGPGRPAPPTLYDGEADAASSLGGDGVDPSTQPALPLDFAEPDTVARTGSEPEAPVSAASVPDPGADATSIGPAPDTSPDPDPDPDATSIDAEPRWRDSP
jgi:MFS family permease